MGFEIALAPRFRQDFRESFYRLIQALTGYRGIITGVPEPISGLGTAAEPVDPTSAESAALEALMRLGESSPETIADQFGLTLEEVTRALGQLVAGHFVNAVESAGQTVYRAATRSLR